MQISIKVLALHIVLESKSFIPTVQENGVNKPIHDRRVLRKIYTLQVYGNTIISKEQIHGEY